MSSGKSKGTSKIAAFLIVGLLIGLGAGYFVGAQSATSELSSLKARMSQLENRELRGTIVVKGSDTLLVVAQLWAEEFMKTNPRVSISVAGGGSGVGFAALIQKTTDIADASREIKSSEIQQAKANGVNPVEWTVGLDGIAIVVNQGNSISELTVQQLASIYNGTYKNWKEVGGNDAPIITYGRQSTSGTYEFFREHVLQNKNFRADNRELAGNAEIVSSVQSDPRGIGYVGVAYTKQGVNVRVLKIRTAQNSVAYDPSVTNVKTGAYPIARKLYIYTNGIPTGSLGFYVSFMLGPEGQRILEEVGYISLVRS